MSFDSEIKDHIRRLRSLSKYKDINWDKLIFLFNNLELDCDDSPPVDYRSLLGAARRNISHDETKGIFQKKISAKLKFALIPAAVLLAIIVSLMTNNSSVPLLERARAISVFGDVRVARGSKKIILKKDDFLLKDDMVYTGKKSFVEIAFGDSHLYRLSERSKLRISKILKKGNLTTVSLSLSSGAVLLNIKKLFSKDSVSVVTPTSVAAVRGTIFGVKLKGEFNTRYEVYEGKIKIGKRIPDSHNNLDEALKTKLKEYFEKNSVIVKKNSICDVEVNNRIYSGLNKSNIDKRLKRIKLPVAVKASKKKFLLAEELIDFIQNSKDPQELRELKLMLKPKTGKIKNSIAGKKEHPVSAVSLSSLKKKAKYHYLLYAKNADLLIFLYSNGIVEARDSENEKWIINIKRRIASKPVIYKNRLYIAAEKEILLAVNVSGGKILWSKKISGKLTDNVGLVISDGYLYAATTKGVLYKLSLNGRKIWESDFDDFFETTPVAGKHMIVASVNGGRVFGVDKRSGFKVIRFLVKSKVSSIIVNKKNIYAVSKAGKVICYNYDMDEVLWSYDLKADVGTDIIFDDNSLFLFTTEGKVVKMSSSGRLLWTSEIGNRITRNPLSDNRNIFVAVDRAFYVIDKNAGNVKWSVVVPRIRSKNVAISKSRVFFVSDKKGITILNK